MKQNIVEFLRNQNQKNREIIDKISGILIQNITDLKETIKNDTLKYSNAKFGSFCKIYLKSQIVIFEFTKLKKKFKFEEINSINKKNIEEILKNLK